MKVARAPAIKNPASLRGRGGIEAIGTMSRSGALRANAMRAEKRIGKKRHRRFLRKLIALARD
jgi:hypothetical protein